MSDEIKQEAPAVSPTPAVSDISSDDIDDDTPSSANTWIKLLSGKFILTVVGAVCFYKFSSTICKLLLAKQQDIEIPVIMSIATNLLMVVSNIFTFYFVRKSMTGNSVPGNTNV